MVNSNMTLTISQEFECSLLNCIQASNASAVKLVNLVNLVTEVRRLQGRDKLPTETG